MRAKNKRTTMAIGFATILGLVVSVFAWNDLSHSVYADTGYLTFDEVLSVLWLLGFGVYLTTLMAMALATTVLLTVVAPVCRWIDRAGG